MKSLPILSLSALVLALAAAAPAAAQLASTKAPVDITADQLETSNTECISTWRGNVEALQDNARLRTDVLKMFFQAKGGAKPATGGGAMSGGSCGEILRMEAQGSVYYVTPQQKVRGDGAVYEAGAETITVTGDVVAVQGQNVLRGERMVINTQTGQGQMQTSIKGRNKPGRVRGVFYPNQSSGSSAAKPASAGAQR